MAELKTKPTDQSVEGFLETVEPEWKRKDSKTLLTILKKTTGKTPVMWGDSIIGFGSYHYKSKAGQEGDWFLAGFSPRKQNMTVYILSGFSGFEEILEKLGKHKKSTGCLYFKRLSDIKIEVLEEIIVKSVETLKERYKEYN